MTTIKEEAEKHASSKHPVNEKNYTNAIQSYEACTKGENVQALVKTMRQLADVGILRAKKALYKWEKANE